MAYTFDLITEPWIPVMPASGGSSTEVGLSELFRNATRYKTIISASSPGEVIGIYRLLLAILYRSCLPYQYQDWLHIYQNGWDDQVNTYLARGQSRFQLFDEDYPFFQDATMTSSQKPVVAITHLPSGHWPHLHASQVRNPHTVSAAEAARYLLGIQATGLGMLSGNPKRPYTDSPIGRPIMFLQQGGNVFQTLMYNLIPLDMHPIKRNGPDLPIWENEQPVGTWLDAPPSGPCNYLTWPSRRIRLTPLTVQGRLSVRELQMTPGPRFDSVVIDPLCRYRRGKDNKTFGVRFSEKEPYLDHWRYLPAIFASDTEHYMPSDAAAFIGRLVTDGILDDASFYQCALLGQATDQAKIFHRLHLHLRFPPRLFSLPESHKAIEEIIETSRNVGKRLRQTLFASYHPSEVVSGYLNAYWRCLQSAFGEMVQQLSLADPEAYAEILADWEKTAVRTAQEVIADTTLAAQLQSLMAKDNSTNDK